MKLRAMCCIGILLCVASCAPTPTASTPPEPLENIVSIAAGWNHSCAVISDGTMKCWGVNRAGQLGDGTAQARYAPVFITGITDATRVAVGESTCVLHAAATVSCWGDGQYVPRPVAGLNNVTDIAVGFDRSSVAEPGTDAHICALIGDGSIECWGNNAVGQLGDGTTQSRETPAPVLGITDAVGIAVGERHTCAVHATGTASCWGSATSGKLGPGITSSQVLPIAVPGVASVVEVDAGAAHTCARLAGGTVTCWGAAGVLGGPGTGIVTVSGLADAVGLDVGVSHSCAVSGAGSVSCWGSNGHLILGGAPPASGYPVVVSSLSGITGVTTGNSHSCALTDEQRAYCWGENTFGKIGDATTQPRPTPVVVLDRFPESDPT